MSNSADKRSVSTDALETLGTIITAAEKRDAIHLAVEPIVAGEFLFPGYDIGIREGKAFRHDVKLVGIVDPFLKIPVQQGERFWLIVYPRQITSLRHVWTHPDFQENEAYAAIEPIAQDTQVTSETSKKWIEKFAISVGLSYDKLMTGAKEWIEIEEYLVYGGLLEGEYVPDEFWEHYQNVTGEKVPEIKQRNFFSCSC